MKKEFVSLEKGILPIEKLLEEEEIQVKGGCLDPPITTDYGCNCECSCPTNHYGCNCSCA